MSEKLHDMATDKGVFLMHSFGELSLNVKIFFKLLRTKLKTLEKLYMKVQNKKDL